MESSKLLKVTWDEKHEQQVFNDPPILLIAGTIDPVGNFTKNVKSLASRYRNYSIKDVTVKFYEGARHELINEINKDEVMGDVLAWLDAPLSTPISLLIHHILLKVKILSQS